MTNYLTDQELALLHSEFVVPLVVGDMLRGLEPLDDTAEYTIHTIMGELYPDTALLCIALCGQHLAPHIAHLPIGKVLAAEADKLVEDYGGVWLSYRDGDAIPDEATARFILNHVPEDLESMRDLFLTGCGELDENHVIATILCDILAEQADLHRDAAEQQLEALSHAASPDQTGSDIASSFEQSGNVIPFPGHQAALRQKP